MRVSKPSLLTHALSLTLCLLFLWFPAPGPVLAAAVPRLAARPWPPLTNGVERRLRIAESGERRAGRRVFVSEKPERGGHRRRRREESLKFASILYSFKSMRALQNTQCKTETWPSCCSVLQQADTMTNLLLSPLSHLPLCMDFSLAFQLLPTKCHASACQRAETQPRWSALLLGHVTNESWDWELCERG